jgi:hypothetical protein
MKKKNCQKTWVINKIFTEFGFHFYFSIVLASVSSSRAIPRTTKEPALFENVSRKKRIKKKKRERS